MFTGLTEKTAKVKDIKITPFGAVIFCFCSDKFNLSEIKTGDSIAVNGVCLSVTSINGNIFSADIMKETLKLSNLKLLKKGDEINLERALNLNSRLNGHIVSGHIDTTADVKEIKSDGFSKRLKISCDTELIIKKGSVAVNGVSLTVCEVWEDCFEVSLIPLTQSETNLKNIKVGDIVNIEYDMFAKYVKKFMENISKRQEKSKITTEFLKDKGF